MGGCELHVGDGGLDVCETWLKMVRGVEEGAGAIAPRLCLRWSFTCEEVSEGGGGS